MRNIVFEQAQIAQVQFYPEHPQSLIVHLLSIVHSIVSNNYIRGQRRRDQTTRMRRLIRVLACPLMPENTFLHDAAHTTSLFSLDTCTSLSLRRPRDEQEYFRHQVK